MSASGRKGHVTTGFDRIIETGKRDLIRAVLEGICYHLCWLLECETRKVKTVYERNYKVFKKLYKSNAANYKALNYETDK